MAAKEVVPPFPLFHDTDGSSLENGFIYIGTAGLDAKLNQISIYWDSEFTEVAAQPVRTINGYYSNNGTPGKLFVRESVYSITVQNKNEVFVYSDITLDTVAQSYVINVKDFGAIGNGVTDDTAAIQAAIDSLDTALLALTGGVIYFPAGSYIISTPIDVDNVHSSGNASVTLRGDGARNTRLTCAAGFTGGQALSILGNYCVLEDIGINGNNNVADGIYVNDANKVYLNRVYLENLTGKGFKIRNVFDCVLTACGTDFVDDASFDFESSAALDTAATINGIECVLRDCYSRTVGATFGSIYTNQVDTGSIDVTVIGFTEESAVGTVSVASGTVGLGHRLLLIDCSFTQHIDGIAVVLGKDSVLRTPGISVTGSNVPVFGVGSAVNETEMLGGLIHIVATNNSLSEEATNGVVASYLIMLSKHGAIHEETLISSNGLDAGSGTADPSFTWAFNTTTNQFQASVVGSTTGTFYFYITQMGGLTLANV